MIHRMGKKHRRAAAAVEMAVVTPILLSMLFGIIEFGWLFTVRHTMVNAAREGARLGAIEGVTVEEIQARVLEQLAPLGIDDLATIDVTEATPDDPYVTVTVSIPQADVSLLNNFFHLTQGTLVGEASMRKEGL